MSDELREDPADDDLPIDEAWLRSIGFVDADPLRFALLELQVSDRPAFILIEDDLTAGFAIGGTSDPSYTHVGEGVMTRGQMRVLCRGLGAELKEQK